MTGITYADRTAITESPTPLKGIGKTTFLPSGEGPP